MLGGFKRESEDGRWPSEGRERENVLVFKVLREISSDSLVALLNRATPSSYPSASAFS